MQTSMGLAYEPSLEPLHVSSKLLFLIENFPRVLTDSELVSSGSQSGILCTQFRIQTKPEKGLAAGHTQINQEPRNDCVWDAPVGR